MLKEEFIKLANQGNARVSLNKKIQDFKKSPLQTYKNLDNKNSFYLNQVLIKANGVDIL